MHPAITNTLATACLALAITLAAQPDASARRDEPGSSRWTPSGRGTFTTARDGVPERLPTKSGGRGKDESLASRRQSAGTAMVGGQVMSPGPVRLGSATTLGSAIRLAGGSVP